MLMAIASWTLRKMPTTMVFPTFGTTMTTMTAFRYASLVLACIVFILSCQDYLDADDDNDGVLDVNEDNDNDGIPDYVDWEINGFRQPRHYKDTDGDGLPDLFDDDDDNDGIVDIKDPDANGDGILDKEQDQDQDGIPDYV